MVDKNTSIGQLLSENPSALDVFNRYGIPCYGNTENQLSSVEDIAIRYGVDVENILSEVNGYDNNNNNTGSLY